MYTKNNNLSLTSKFYTEPAYIGNTEKNLSTSNKDVRKIYKNTPIVIDEKPEDGEKHKNFRQSIPKFLFNRQIKKPSFTSYIPESKKAETTSVDIKDKPVKDHSFNYDDYYIDEDNTDDYYNFVRLKKEEDKNIISKKHRNKENDHVDLRDIEKWLHIKSSNQHKIVDSRDIDRNILAANKDFFTSIVSFADTLSYYLKDIKDTQKNSAVELLKAKKWFNLLQEHTNKQPQVEYISCNNKYADIKCPEHSSATIGRIYHANYIDFSEGLYIAAQGPSHNVYGVDTTSDFIALLAENSSAISVSLVSKEEFAQRPPLVNKNSKLNPQKIGEILEVPEVVKGGKLLRCSAKIVLLHEINNKEAGIKIDIFLINGQRHLRIYDLKWRDKTGGDPIRLAAIAMLVERLRVLLGVENNSGDFPVVVNCDAGVGRTGTFILINNMARQYINNSPTSTKQIEENILTARQSRPFFVQTASQLETINRINLKKDEYFQVLAKTFDLV